MGRFLNKGNQKFAEFSRTKYFIDKTDMLNVLLEKDADEKFICSRPRRFGKLVTADMMTAFFRYYHRPVREFPGGKGFADIVYLPLARHPNRPVVVVELKWNQSAQTAITQIKERAYPESQKDYSGEILLAGITYNKKTKEHQCVIECFQKEDSSSLS